MNLYQGVFKDQMGKLIYLDAPPERIISLVPSQTELLIDLGLADKIVGRTKFCIHTQEVVRKIPQIGGTKNPRIKDILDLQPDLIIGNKEENDKNIIEQLQPHTQVWMSDILCLADAYEMIRELGLINQKQFHAEKLINDIQSEHDLLINFVGSSKKKNKPECLYLIWKGPYMAAGTNTFIDHMIHICGFINSAGYAERYPELSPDTIQKLDPDIIFLSSEPYPFSNKDVSELESILPDRKIILVDGEMFSWYGSRLKKAFPYFKKLIQSL